MARFGKYFCGNLISEYGRKSGYVDYATLAKAFDCVMCNDIISKTNYIVGEWELENGSEFYYVDSEENEYTYDEKEERIAELEEQIEELEEAENPDEHEIEKLQEEIEILNEEHCRDMEIFQYFIISASGAEILKDYTDEYVWYNEELNIYVWGITHCGTSWTYVLTNIECDREEEENP